VIEPALPPALTPLPEPAPIPSPPSQTGSTLDLVNASVRAVKASDGGQGAFIFLEPADAAFLNLATPVAYASGTLHVQIQVGARPSTEPVSLQFCIVPGDFTVVSPLCTDTSTLLLPTSGTISTSVPMTRLEDGAVDWRQGISQLLVVLRDGLGRPLDDRYTRESDGSPIDLGPYFPLQLTVRAALVAPGGAFSGW
jgi:hypothetical protein